MTVAVAMLLSVGLPTGLVPDGGWPLPGLWSWLQQAKAAAAGLGAPKLGPPAGRLHNPTVPAWSGRGNGDDGLWGEAGLLPNGQPRRAGGGSWTSSGVGGVFDRATSRRVAGQSTETSTFYANADGSVTRVLAAGRVNYRASDGSWRPIDSRLVAAGSRLVSAANDVVVAVAGPAAARGGRTGDALDGWEGGVRQHGAWTELASVTLPGGQVFGFDLLGADRVLPDVSGSTALYRELLAHTDVELVSTPSGLKETLVLHSPESASMWRFSLRLVGLTPRLAPDGSVALLDGAGEVAASIPPGVMRDSAPVDATGEPPTSYGVSYALREQGGQTLLEVSADQAWLDAPERVYPVKVDPTVTTTAVTGDVYVDNDSGTSNQNGDNLPIGTYNGGTTMARSFLHFDNFDTSAAAGKRIVSAKLKLFHTWSYDCNNTEPVYVRKVLGTWSVSGYTTGGWSGAPTTAPIGSKVLDNWPACTNAAGDRNVGEDIWVTLNPGAFSGWSDLGSGDNNGLSLTASETNSYGWKRFTSANFQSGVHKAELEITWVDNLAPQVNWMQPASGDATSTLTPQLLADAHDTDVWPKTLTYNFTVFEFTPDEAIPGGVQTLVADSGWVASRTWSVPSGVLQWGKTYRWAVRVYDGRAYSTETSPAWRQVLVTPPPQRPVLSSLSSNGDRGYVPGAGNYTIEAVDAQVAGVGPALSVQRSYNSADPRTAGAFGAGWSSLPDTKVVERYHASGALWTVAMTFPTGAVLAFAKQPDGSFASPHGRFSTMTAIAGGYQLVDKEGTGYTFTEALGGGSFGLTSVADFLGRTLTLGWANGKVSSMTSTTSGRTLTLDWQGGSHVRAVTDPDGKAWSYTYDGDKLTAVCPPVSGAEAADCTRYGYTTVPGYAAVVADLDPYSYLRLGEAPPTPPAPLPAAASEVAARMGMDVGVYSNVTLGETPGPVAGATVARLDGTSSSVSLPVSRLAQTNYQTFAMWFKQTAGDGVLYSQSWDKVGTATTNGAYAPILYTGSDGKLYGQFPTAVDPGLLYTLTQAGSGLCIKASAAVDMGYPYLATCADNENQRFTWDSSQRLSLTIGGVTKCLDVRGGTTALSLADNAEVILYGCTSTDNQKWTVHPDGRIVSKISGKCLDTFASGQAANTTLVQWSCARARSKTQSWLSPVHDPMVSTNTVNDGAWHHVALTVNGDLQTLYLDGVLADDKTAAVVDIAPAYSYLGFGFMGGRWPKPAQASNATNKGSPDYFNGQISDVAQFARPLTAAEVTTLAGQTQPAIAVAEIYRATGATGDPLIDGVELGYDPASGRLNHVTDANGGQWGLAKPTVSGSSLVHASKVLGADPADYWRLAETAAVAELVNEVNGAVATPTAGLAFGAVGPFADATAASFNGTSHYALADASSVATNAAYSVSAWVYLDATAANSYRTAVSVDGANISGFFLGYDQANKWRLAVCPQDSTSTPTCANATSAAPELATWTHLVGTYSPTTNEIKLYVNGQLADTKTIATPWLAPGPLVVGASKWTSYGSFWQGRLAEVATYRATLSAEQVTAQYQARNLLLQGQPARVVAVTDPADKTITYVYDAASGQPLQTVDQRGVATKYGYNIDGFASQVVDGNGNAIKYAYDVRGNVVEQTSCLDESAADCSTAFYSYYPDATSTVLNPGDRRNDVLLTARDARSSDAADTRYLTSHSYDATTGNLLSTTAPLARVTSFTYTTAATPAVGGGYAPAGLPWTKTAPGGGVTTLEYFSNGDLARTTDPAGKRTDYTYTATGRVATETVYSSHFPAGVVSSYTYDGQGRVLTYTGPPVTDEVTGEPRQLRTSTVYYEPDATGYTMRNRQQDLADPLLPVREATVHINTQGRKDRQVDAEGNQTLFHYNAFGQLYQTTYPDGQVVNIGYDDVGNPLYTEIVNYQPGVNLRPTTKTYDGGNRVIRIDDAQGNPGSPNNWYTTYEYTDNNLVRTITRWDGAGGSFITEQNSYDDAGHLTQQVTNNGRTIQTFAPDYAGRVESTTLDPAGLLKRKRVYTYSPDDQVLVTELQDATNNNALVGKTESLYDPLGRIVASTSYTASALSPVARWRLNETSGTAAVDSAGNSTAIATGGVTWSSDHNGSASFDGIGGPNGSALTTAGPILDTSRSFTGSAWVKLTDTSYSNRFALSQDGTQHSGFNLGWERSTNRWTMWVCSANTTMVCTTAYATTTPVLGVWVHLTGVYDQAAGQVRIYVNGQLETSSALAAPYPAALGPLAIGRAKWLGNTWGNWGGGIDDVQVYQRALSTADVQAVYANGYTPANETVTRTSSVRDEAGNITKSIDPNGAVTDIEVDPHGRMVVTTGPAVATTVFDPSTGGPITVPDGRAQTRVGYNAFGEQASVDANGDVTSYQYDNNGNLVLERQPTYTPPGGAPVQPETSYGYDESDRLASVTDPLGRVTSYEYDAFGRTTRVSAPYRPGNDAVTTVSYDLVGVTRRVDPTGAKVDAEYDFLGRPTESTVTVREGQTELPYLTLYEYDNAAGGWLSQVTTPSGLESSATYNPAGQPVSATDPAGLTTSYGYDPVGRLNRITAADTSYVTATYDLAGRLAGTSSFSWEPSHPQVASTSQTYDRSGNVVTATDPRLHITTFEYDATNLLTRLVEPTGPAAEIVSSFGYDLSGQRTAFTNGEGHTFYTTYTPWGLVESQVEPATTAHPYLAERTFTTGYDMAGQPVAQLAPGGVVVSNTFDAAGLVASSSGTGAEAATAARSFDYDKLGRPTQIVGGAGTIDLTWDDRSLLRTVTGAAGAATFTYTDDGQLLTRTDAAGTTSFGYDTANGRLNTVTNPTAGLSLAYQYLSNSPLLQKITYGGGNKRVFSYDGAHRLATDDLQTPGGANLATIDYEYDDSGNLVHKTTTGFAGAADNSYEYDWANRLTEWTAGASTVSYAYDKAGNRVQAGTRTFTYNERNQLLSSPSDALTYEYTARGTLRRAVSAGGVLETFADAFGQVTTQASSPTESVSYSYDGLGRVVRPGFAYSGTGNQLASDGQSSYVRGVAGELLGAATGGSQRYAWTDQHTDVVGQFTATGSGLDGSTTYDPYGKVLASAGMVGALGYQSEWTDTATGRVNMHARWYNPDTGRFDTRDSVAVGPVPASGAANRYAYAAANPLTRTDPTGHDFMSNCSSLGGCLVQGFVNSFDLVGMVKDLWGAFSNLRQTVSDLINGIRGEAARWTSQLRSAMNCSWLLSWACDKAAAIGGWTCALTGICDVIHDCMGGDRLRCAEQVGAAAADGIKALIGILTGGSATVATITFRIAQRALKLLKKFNLPDRRYQNRHRSELDQFKVDPKKAKMMEDYDRGEREDLRTLRSYSRSASHSAATKRSSANTTAAAKRKAKAARASASGSKSGSATSPARSAESGSATSTPARSADPVTPAPSSHDSNQPSQSDAAAPLSCPIRHSFRPDTPVLMADGTTRPIEKVRVGDRVRATDPHTGKTKAEPVTLLHHNLDTELAEVTVAAPSTAPSVQRPTGRGDGERSTRGPTATLLTATLLTATLHTTANHPFWDATTRTWTEAKDLKPGTSTLIGPDGQTQQVTYVTTYTGAAYMRDLTVATTHTYYVLAGAAKVLVHNNDACRTAVLGVQQYSDDLAGRLRSEDPGGVFETYNGRAFAGIPEGSFRPAWMDRVSSAVTRGSGYRIAFALDDLRGTDPLDMVRKAVKEGGRLDPRGLPLECATCWELRQVLSAVQNGDLSRGAVTFYLGGHRLDDFNPFD